jgi:MFS family permease
VAAAGIRSFAIGLTGVLLGITLAQRGFGAAAIGVVVGFGLAGNAVATALVAALGERLGRRRTLVLAAFAGAVGLLAVALAHSTILLAAFAFAGLVNGMGRDRGPAQTLEQSLLADTTPDDRRTAAFARYALVQDVAGALGSLAAAAPTLLASVTSMGAVAAGRWTFGAAAAVSLVPLVLYAAVPDPAPRVSTARAPMNPETRRRLAGLSGLFALDSLGGGFLAGSIVTYWFFRRFGVGGDVLGPLFFAGRVLNALSYGWAERLAARIGLVRTMVFTHLPSSLVLLALPLAPTAWAAAALFLMREALVQMDVPTRTAYVTAITRPGERTAALGITGLVRNVGWAVGPALAGASTAAFGLAAPLVAGAGLKIVYDLALFASFRHVEG